MGNYFTILYDKTYSFLAFDKTFNSSDTVIFDVDGLEQKSPAKNNLALPIILYYFWSSIGNLNRSPICLLKLCGS